MISEPISKMYTVPASPAAETNNDPMQLARIVYRSKIKEFKKLNLVSSQKALETTNTLDFTRLPQFPSKKLLDTTSQKR